MKLKTRIATAIAAVGVAALALTGCTSDADMADYNTK